MEEWQYQTWKGAALKRAARFMQNQALAAALNSWKQHHSMCLMERAVAKFTLATSSRWAQLGNSLLSKSAARAKWRALDCGFLIGMPAWSTSVLLVHGINLSADCHQDA